MSAIKLIFVLLFVAVAISSACVFLGGFVWYVIPLAYVSIAEWSLAAKVILGAGISLALSVLALMVIGASES